MATMMDATVTRLDGTDEAMLVSDGETGVSLERREKASLGRVESSAIEMDGDRLLPWSVSEPVNESGLVFTNYRPVEQRCSFRIGRGCGVQPIGSDGKIGFAELDVAGDLEREAHRSVHRGGDRDGICPVDRTGVPCLDRQVDRLHIVACVANRGGRTRHMDRLSTELVCRDEEDSHDDGLYRRPGGVQP